jgi:hypothetical protein
MSEKKVAEGLAVKKWERKEGGNGGSKEVVMRKEWVEEVNRKGSVSEKILYLDSVGLGRSDIAGVLGVRYNWVYNVLRNSGRLGEVVSREVKVIIVE